MNWYVEESLQGKPDCYGAPYTCKGYDDKCRNCLNRVDCASTAIDMVFSVAAGDITLEGVTSDKRRFVNSVGNFLPKNYVIHRMPLSQPSLEIIKACYARSKHLIPPEPNVDEVDDLSDLLGDLSEPIEAGPIETIATTTHQPVHFEDPKAFVPTQESPSLSSATSAENKDNVMPLFPGKISTTAAPAIKLPIEAWERNKVAMAALSDEALAKRVISLSLERASGGVGLVPYSEIREDFCAVNIEINLRKRFAPRFREMRRPVFAFDMSKDEMLLRDRIVIDLHWLHCRGVNKQIILPRSVDPGFASLLLSSEFDFDAAWRFACLEKKMATRAGWLKLNDDIAWQLATIESDAMKNRFYTIMNGEKRKGVPVQIGYYDIGGILESCVPNRLKQNIPTWATIWMCNRILRRGSKEPTMTAVALLHVLATGRGTPLDRKNIGGQLASCERYIENYSRTSKLAA